MITPLTVPAYDAIVLPDKIAYPTTYKDAMTLVCYLTQRYSCVPLDWETVGVITFALDDTVMRATYEIEGEWPDREQTGLRVRMMVAISNVHVFEVR